ncbi:6084_t:CDS:2, partial [Cetraspora pellucida]
MARINKKKSYVFQLHKKLQQKERQIQRQQERQRAQEEGYQNRTAALKLRYEMELEKIKVYVADPLGLQYRWSSSDKLVIQ